MDALNRALAFISENRDHEWSLVIFRDDEGDSQELLTFASQFLD